MLVGLVVGFLSLHHRKASCIEIQVFVLQTPFASWGNVAQPEMLLGLVCR